MKANKILDVKGLQTTFIHQKQQIYAVRGVDFSINEGEILAIVGESGSGKSVTMKSIMGILPEHTQIQAEYIQFEGKDILSLPEAKKRALRGNDIAMIFQDPMTALNPLKTIGSHLTEVIGRYHKMTKKQAIDRAIAMLKKVGIPSPENRMKQYPHEFSGGMRQRVLIAMALCSGPKLLIADEPTTALDVTIQAQILKLLKELSVSEQMSIILITHDLGVVASLADRIAVMYGGLIMEKGTTDEIFYEPAHPYTKALLKAIPQHKNGTKERLIAIPGSAPSLIDPPGGCPFADRCQYATEKCKQAVPDILVKEQTSHEYRCLYNTEQLSQIKKEKAYE